MKRIAALILALIMVFVLAACGNGNTAKPSSGTDDNTQTPAPSNDAPTATGADVAGTYTVTYGTQEISGNIRHTGYITSQGGQEKNTLVLNADGTYEYTKLVSTDETIIASGVASTENTGSFVLLTSNTTAPQVVLLASTSAPLLFSWEPNNEGDSKGSCTMDFYADGTYEFQFPSYSISEEGTWKWENWSMTLTKPDGAEVAVEMDEEHSLKMYYEAAINSMLNQNFIVKSDVWGNALGQTGSYEPAAASDAPAEALDVRAAFTGTATRKTSDGNDYEVAITMIMLTDGTVYLAEDNAGTVNVSLGTYEGNIITIGDKSAQTEGAKLVWDGAELSYAASVPEAYANADWAKLIEEAQAPAATGPVVLKYVFTGTYTADGTTVTLNPPTACQWSEDWGIFQNHGFKNGSGNENDKVWPKGESDKYFWAIEHFVGPYVIANSHPAEEEVPASNTTSQAVEVNPANGTFDYIIVSAFD